MWCDYEEYSLSTQFNPKHPSRTCWRCIRQCGSVSAIPLIGGRASKQQLTTKRNKIPTVTLKSFITGAMLIPLNVYWLIRLEMVWGGTYPSTITLLMPAVFSVSVLIGVNYLLARLLH